MITSRTERSIRLEALEAGEKLERVIMSAPESEVSQPALFGDHVLGWSKEEKLLDLVPGGQADNAEQSYRLIRKYAALNGKTRSEVEGAYSKRAATKAA